MYAAGVDGKKIAFQFAENNIYEVLLIILFLIVFFFILNILLINNKESFLEDLNNLINLGEVPNLI